jgi:replicative DNA helicase
MTLNYSQLSSILEALKALQEMKMSFKLSLIIAKNRNGRLATIDFMFQKHIGRFVEMDNVHQPQ